MALPSTREGPFSFNRGDHCAAPTHGNVRFIKAARPALIPTIEQPDAELGKQRREETIDGKQRYGDMED